MKKIARLAAITVAGALMFGFTNKPADTNFEGIITYSEKVESDNPQAQQMMQGATFKMYMKGGKFRAEFNSSMIKIISIVDSKDPDNAINLREMFGNKYQIKTDDKAKKAADASQPDIKYLSGTKTIAGYDCKEAQITSTNSQTGAKFTDDVYYTDQLPYSNGKSGDFNGLKGFPMSFQKQTQGGGTTTMVAQSVQKGSVDDSEFTLPAGYKLVTQQEMMQDMMSQRGGGGN